MTTKQFRVAIKVPPTDLSFWANKKTWTVIEATYLLAGIRLTDDTPDDFHFYDPWKKAACEKVHKKITRAIDEGALKPTKSKYSGDLLNPNDVLKWAKENQIKIPKTLKELSRPEPRGRPGHRKENLQRIEERVLKGTLPKNRRALLEELSQATGGQNIPNSIGRYYQNALHDKLLNFQDKIRGGETIDFQLIYDPKDKKAKIER